MLRAISFGLLLAILVVPTAEAQVQGVCVSGCNIPSAPSTPSVPSPPDPRFNIIGAQVLVEGDVQVHTPDGRVLDGRAAFSGAVPLGSKVVTGPSSKLILLLPDETSFNIGPLSEVTLDEFVYDPVATAAAGKISARVVKGKVRIVDGKIARKSPENVKIKIAVGDLGIRGTDFEVNIDPAGSGYVELYEGAVYLTEYDTGKVYTLRPGQRLQYENFRIIGVE